MNQAKARFFDEQAAAGWAAEEYGEVERPKLARLLGQSELAPGQWVLEPGCGTGRLSQVLASVVGPQGHLVALDISQGMVEACRQRVAGLSWVRVEQMALEEFAAPAGSFDRVVCHQVFPHFDDHPAALAHMVRLLKPGGLLTVVHFMPSQVINDTHRKAGTVVEQDLLPEPEQMRRLVEAAGLELEVFHDDDLGYFLKARLTAADSD